MRTGLALLGIVLSSILSLMLLPATAGAAVDEASTSDGLDGSDLTDFDIELPNAVSRSRADAGPVQELGSLGYLAWWYSRLAEIDCVGLDSDELAAVVEDQGSTRLPAAYEGFLKVAGRQCGALWVGSDAFPQR